MLTDGQARNGHPNLAWPRESLRGRIFAMNNSTRARAREGSRSNLAYTLPKCLKMKQCYDYYDLAVFVTTFSWEVTSKIARASCA
jgi:hypothetical protein